MGVRIGTNEPGGTFNVQGAALADMLAETAGMEVELLTTTNASVANAGHLDRDEADFGFMASNWIGRAVAGRLPFEHPIALRMAAPANAGPMFFITLADSPIRTVADLRGRRVAVGVEDGGMTQHIRTMFGVLGISFDAFTPVYVSFPEGADLLVAGEVDAQWQCPVPNALMTSLSQRAHVRVVPYAAGQLEKLLAEIEFYKPAVVEKGAFRGVNADMAQLGVLNIIATHERVDEALVCKLVTAMVEHTEDLARRCPLYRSLALLFDPLRTAGAAALECGGVPLHPGALRAYRETGLLD